jgi:hypothetical protein
MWVIQKRNNVALWNKQHFEEEKMEIIQHVYNIQYGYLLNKYKMGNLRGYTLSHKRHVFRKNGTVSKIWSLSSSTTFVWNIFQYNEKWARYDQESSRRLRVIVKLYNSFSTLSHERHVLRKKLLIIKCVFWFYLQFHRKRFWL